MKRVLDPLNPDEGLLMVTREEWDELKASRKVVKAARERVRRGNDPYGDNEILERALASR